MPLTRDWIKIKEILDREFIRHDRKEFIDDDPISIPHRFTKKQDIEIAAFFAAIFSWGNRKTIINKSSELMRLMDDAPFNFCRNHSERDLKPLIGFVHRTFNSDDLLYFISFLRHHYQLNDSLESAFFETIKPTDEEKVEKALNHFYDYFFSLPYLLNRTRKHIAAPKNKSACKRLNMFLRWMIRKDEHGVDFGLWKTVNPSDLICPIDVHVSRIARQLHLLDRKQNDWQAAIELTKNLRTFDPDDPVKYDYALFGIGVKKT